MEKTSISRSSGSRVDVTLRLPQLQNLCKRDPRGYRSDYDAQIRRLSSECEILRLSPSSNPSSSEDLVPLIQFAAAVSSSSYKGEESTRIANMLINLLMGADSSSSDKPNDGSLMASLSNANVMQLNRGIRKACISALILMRNKGTIKPLRILELFFRIMSCVPDKAIRESLHRHIVNDVRNINKKGRRDEKLNRSIQNFLHKVVTATSGAAEAQKKKGKDLEGVGDVAARRAVEMVCELYRRNVWTDERSVAILASAVQSPIPSVMSRAIRFFLNIEEKMAHDKAREEERNWDGAKDVNFHLYSKKTSKRIRKTAKMTKQRAKVQTSKDFGEDMFTFDAESCLKSSKKLYPAIELLNNPQGNAEIILKRIRSSGSTYKFENKLLMINFVTRLVGNHELLLLDLYPLLQKYMGGHQRDVTAILAYSVQACHPYVPPEELHGLLKTISHNFITERCSSEQMAVGINAVRAICHRAPSLLSNEDHLDECVGSVIMDIEAFSRDLAGFANHRERSVAIAGRAWTNFIRNNHPSLLKGKTRGIRGTALHKAGHKPLRYGEESAEKGVKGADLLLEYESKKAAYTKNKTLEQKTQKSYYSDDESSEEDDEDSWEEMEEEEAETDDQEEWTEVEHPQQQGSDKDDNTETSDEDSEGEEETPLLIPLDNTVQEPQEPIVDLSTMTPQERSELREEISSTRIFSTSDFEKMRKLVDREEKLKRDPRAAARKKRALARGLDFQELSDDSDSSDDEDLIIKGAVAPRDIMAMEKKKRLSKIEKLEKVLAGREKFTRKVRDGGSTNTEKQRKKLFVMQKFSMAMRKKKNSKDVLSEAKNHKTVKGSHASKKRRRKV